MRRNGPDTTTGQSRFLEGERMWNGCIEGWIMEMSFSDCKAHKLTAADRRWLKIIRVKP